MSASETDEIKENYVNKPNVDLLKNKSKGKTRATKRKREPSASSDEDDVLPENTLEVDNNLHALAIKNNLDDVSVKKILKKVVTNDHVLAFVKLREEEELAQPTKDIEPKITRAKYKELMKVSPKSVTRNVGLTPIKHIPVKTRPEVTALIAQDLPEDEDDEEYEPTPDDLPSDDDHVTCSDVDSQPATPATPKSATKSSPKVVTDGPFKVPQDTVSQARKKLDLEEEATIALRTRSKLCLSETPIEHIESSFVPPDDIPLPDVDDLWNDFLLGCLDPVSNTRHEDDDEADPEYNVAADPDAAEEDETLENSIIKISKNELDDLMRELLSVMPEQELTPLLNDAPMTNGKEVNIKKWEGKQEPLSDEEIAKTSSERLTFERHDNICISIGKSEPEEYKEACIAEATAPNTEKSDDTNTVLPPPAVQTVLDVPPNVVEVQVDDKEIITQVQILILQQQIRMHVQVSASNFLQLYVNPTHWSYAPKYKEYLESLNQMVELNSNSVVNVCNLKPALELVKTWEATVSEDNRANIEMIEFMQDEAEKCRRRSLMNNVYMGDFPEMMKQVVASSGGVFVYPHLLPATPFRPDLLKRRLNYLPSEERLIVLGLDQFWSYVEANPDIYSAPSRGNPRHRWGFTATVELVCKHMFPWLSMKTLACHIKAMRKQKTNEDHPIKKFFASRYVEPTEHTLLPFSPEITLYEQPEDEVPRIWIRYLAKTSKRFRSFYNKRRIPHAITPKGLKITPDTNIQEAQKRPLPIIFTEMTKSNRINVHEVQPTEPDRIDINIQKEPISSLCTIVQTNSNIVLAPIEAVPDNNNSSTDNTKTTDNVNSSIDNKTNTDSNHCTCCILLRKISKFRQKRITEYIKKFNVVLACPCRSVKHPKMSNKLKLLLRYYKGYWKHIFDKVQDRIEMLSGKGNGLASEVIEEESKDMDAKDFAFVTMFQIRLAMRENKVRNTLIKRRLFTILSRYNPDTGDPTDLMKNIFEACDIDLADMYKEFLGFLTAEQAEKIGKFKDYFVQNCMETLIVKTEELVKENEAKVDIFKYLQNLSTMEPPSCVICTNLLECMKGYPELARYCFSLFPHKAKKVPRPKSVASNREIKSEVHTQQINIQVHITGNEQVMDYEVQNKNGVHASGSGSSNLDEDEAEQGPLRICEDSYQEPETSSGEEETKNIEAKNTTEMNGSQQSAKDITEEADDTVKNTVIKSEIVDDIDDQEESILCYKTNQHSEDNESSEWQRDDDKLILEYIQEYITPETNFKNFKDDVFEILEEKNVPQMIAERLMKKSIDDVRDRMSYLLEVLQATSLKIMK